MMTGLYSCRIAPFGNPRINAYLRLPVAYRSLSRPSSAPSAKAFALRPCSLDQIMLVLSAQFVVCYPNSLHRFCDVSP